jgi:hypothetical protein
MASTGYLAREQLTPEDQAQVLVDVLESRAQIDVVWVRPTTLLQLWGEAPEIP